MNRHCQFFIFHFLIWIGYKKSTIMLSISSYKNTSYKKSGYVCERLPTLYHKGYCAYESQILQPTLIAQP